MPSRPRHHGRSNSLTLQFPTFADLHGLLPLRPPSKRAPVLSPDANANANANSAPKPKSRFKPNKPGKSNKAKSKSSASSTASSSSSPSSSPTTATTSSTTTTTTAAATTTKTSPQLRQAPSPSSVSAPSSPLTKTAASALAAIRPNFIPAATRLTPAYPMADRAPRAASCDSPAPATADGDAADATVSPSGSTMSPNEQLPPAAQEQPPQPHAIPPLHSSRTSRSLRSGPNPLASLSGLPGLPVFSSRGLSSSHPRRSQSARRGDREALITMFGRPFVGSRSSTDGGSSTTAGSSGVPTDYDTVSMSSAGQKVIPATFNLVPIEPSIGGATTTTSNSDTASTASTTTTCGGGRTGSTSGGGTDQSSSLHPTKTFDQAGGHKGSFHIDGATLVKKVTEREALFYEAAEAGAWPTALLPTYYGRAGAGGDAIKIENLTHGFDRPCVIDLKMGVQTVEDDETSLLKKLKMTALDHLTRSRSAGCRLEGLSMYRTLENRRIKGTKTQSHSISAHVGVSLQDVLTFFLTDESGVRTDVALRFQIAVEQILKQFEQNRTYRFIGSSILLIYDNDNSAPYMHWARALRKLHTIAPHVRLSEDQISGLTRRTKCDVRMIDFAHTGPLPPSMERDEGYITGLRTILKALMAIRVYRSKPIFSMQNAVVDLMEETRASRLASSGSGSGSGSSSSSAAGGGASAGVPGGEADGTDGDGSSLQGDFTFDSVLGELTALSESSSVAPTVPFEHLGDGE